MSALNPKQQLFVLEYLKDLNATQAAIRAGYSAHTAEQIGYQLLQNPSVSEAVQTAIAERNERVALTTDDVLREWYRVATADVRELIEYRRTCCRFCYGVNHLYHFTPAEYEREKSQHEALHGIKDLVGEPVPTFNERGGVGFDPRKEPHPECPECFGEGVEKIFAKDTRKLSKGAARLFDGVKVTKDGYEIKIRARDKSWEMTAQHLGLVKNKVEVSGNLNVVERILNGRRRSGS